MDGYDLLILVVTGTVLGRFLVHIIGLRQRGLKINHLGYKKQGLPRLVEIAILPLAMLMLIEVVAHALYPDVRQAGLWPLGSWHQAAGAVLLVAALILLWLTLRHFGPSYRLGVDHTNPGALVRKGVFAYSRNPIYLGLDSLFAGCFLIYPNWFFFFMMIGACLTMHFMILSEERALKVLYGQAYLDYQKAVPRYLGLTLLKKGGRP